MFPISTPKSRIARQNIICTFEEFSWRFLSFCSKCTIREGAPTTMSSWAVLSCMGGAANLVAGILAQSPQHGHAREIGANSHAADENAQPSEGRTLRATSRPIDWRRAKQVSHILGISNLTRNTNLQLYSSWLSKRRLKRNWAMSWGIFVEWIWLWALVREKTGQFSRDTSYGNICNHKLVNIFRVSIGELWVQVLPCLYSFLLFFFRIA